MDEQVIENESIMDEMRSHAEETEYKLNKLQLEFDQQKDTINNKDLEINIETFFNDLFLMNYHTIWSWRPEMKKIPLYEMPPLRVSHLT